MFFNLIISLVILGSTPLHMAATNGRGEAVSILLCRGADPNIMTRSGDTSLHLAAQHGHTEVVCIVMILI